MQVQRGSCRLPVAAETLEVVIIKDSHDLADKWMSAAAHVLCPTHRDEWLLVKKCFLVLTS